jgi:hypothetical protein
MTWHIVGAGLDLRVTLLDTARITELGQVADIGQLSVRGTRDGNDVEGAGTLLFTPEGAS